MAARMPLVLAAGLLCDETIWRPVADLLTDVAECHIIDFIGCRSMGAMADRLLAAAPPSFALAGHSMGARVAIEACARARDRVARIALLNTGIHAVGAAEPENRGVLVDLARTRGMEALTDAWLPPMMSPAGRQDDALMRRLGAMVRRSTPESFAGQIEALLTRPDAETPLATLSIPTLLLSATEDSWSPPAQHAAMLTLVPHARLVIVPGAGHMAPVEQPGRVAAALRDWLSR